MMTCCTRFGVTVKLLTCYSLVVLARLRSSVGRIPFPHRGPHPGSPEDQTQAGGGGQEAHLPLREEDSVQERQSVVSIVSLLLAAPAVPAS